MGRRHNKYGVAVDLSVCLYGFNFLHDKSKTIMGMGTAFA